ncbi:MAG: DUF2142 domain-containing protein [Anaerolineae bacterium]|nr:DUF2142 domain-containing protein [Anaerolineae bacterium]
MSPLPSGFHRRLFALFLHPLALPCVLLLFLFLGFLYSAVTPLYEAPDEVWHDAYVRWVAQGKGLPPLDEDRSGAYQEAAQPPLYYLAAAAVRRFFPDDDLSELMWHNPQFGYQAGGTVNDNKNMLIHTDRERFPWRGAALAVHATRLVSLLFGLLTVLGTWALARETVGSPATTESRPSLCQDQTSLIPLWAAALVAFHPQFLFISGVVNNDSAAAATATFALWAIARVLRCGADLRRSFLLGLALGLAALTKTSELLLVPLALVALLFAPTPMRRKIPAGILALGLAFAVGGWWYIRNLLLYNDPLGISRHIQTPWGRSQPAPLMVLLWEMPRLYRSFWGAFGWGHVEYPAWVYALLGGLILLSLLGWTVGLLRRRIPGHPGILLLAAAWCGLVFLALLQWMRQVEAPHGRLLFPALSAWALLMTCGWSLGADWKSAFPGHKVPSVGLRRRQNPASVKANQGLAAPARSIPFGADQPSTSADALSQVGEGRPSAEGLLMPTSVGADRDSSCATPAVGEDRPSAEGQPRPTSVGAPLLLLLLCSLSLLTPWLVIRPAFAPPRLVDPTQVGDGLYRYGGQILLLSASLKRDSVFPGEWLPVRLCWMATAPVEADYTVVVQLVGRENVRVGERHTYPGLGRFPTSLWPVGRAFCDIYRIRVEPWASVPELYDVLVGLYEEEPDLRLPVSDLGGMEVKYPVVAQARIVPARPPTVSPARPLDYRLGDAIRLMGYDLRRQDGETIALVLYWWAERDVGEDYRVFVHLLDAGGNLLAQHDGPPRWGRYPTRAWRKGDVVPDEHILVVPEGTKPPLSLAVGMYRPETMERLPVSGPGGQVSEGRVLIPLLP